jgi:hypothetical protein
MSPRLLRLPKLRRAERPTLSILLLLLFILAVGLCCRPHQAAGSSLDCEGLADPDRRNLCRAVTRGDPTWCELIRSRDLRAECRALTKR